MLTLLGLAGMVLIIAAYYPQVMHLIHDKCVGGLTARAYYLWLASAFLLLMYAAAIGDPIFMTVQILHSIAIGLIAYYSRRYSGSLCEAHRVAFDSASSEPPTKAQK